MVSRSSSDTSARKRAVWLVVGISILGLVAAAVATSLWGVLGLAAAMVGTWALCALALLGLYQAQYDAERQSRAAALLDEELLLAAGDDRRL